MRTGDKDEVYRDKDTAGRGGGKEMTLDARAGSTRQVDGPHHARVLDSGLRLTTLGGSLWPSDEHVYR